MATYEVSAFNTGAASENKIHDDSVARRLVSVADSCRELKCTLTWRTCRWPVGVELGLKKAGRALRFLKPVYDGALTRVTATDKDHSLSLCVESAGLRCATGAAFMPSDCRLLRSRRVSGKHAARHPTEGKRGLARAGASFRHCAVDDRTRHALDLSRRYSRNRSYLPCQGLVHPGQILRLANNALVQNVLLGPWIYVGSKVRNHTAVRVGEQLTLRSKITSNVVSKGHAIVEFDAIVVADGARTVTEITHAAIWLLPDSPRRALSYGADLQHSHKASNEDDHHSLTPKKIPGDLNSYFGQSDVGAVAKQQRISVPIADPKADGAAHYRP